MKRRIRYETASGTHPALTRQLELNAPNCFIVKAEGERNPYTVGAAPTHRGMPLPAGSARLRSRPRRLSMRTSAKEISWYKIELDIKCL